MKNFVIIGVGGYIVFCYLEVIKGVGYNFIVVYDNKDFVGIMDCYFLECWFFIEFERFEFFVDFLNGFL